MSVVVNLFESLVLDRPRPTLVGVALLTAILALFIPRFELDASGDSLLLEEDADLRYYRGVIARYGSDNFVVVTYRARQDLFSPSTLAKATSSASSRAYEILLAAKSLPMNHWSIERVARPSSV